MTVAQLRALLSWMPNSVEVTDSFGNTITDVVLDDDCLKVRLGINNIHDEDKD